MSVLLNKYKNFFFIDGNYNFAGDWEEIDKENYTIVNPYLNKECSKNDVQVITNGTNFLLNFEYLQNITDVGKFYDFSLTLNNKIYIINNSYYSKFNGIFERDINTNVGGFLFTKSGLVQYDLTKKIDKRCDYGQVAPLAFIGAEGSAEASVDIQAIQAITLADIKTAQVIFSLFDVGHIVYMETHDPQLEMFAQDEREVPCATRTISEQLKLIWEWSELTKPPFNSSQDISVYAKKFLEAYNMKEEIVDDLVANQSGMQIAKFLSGDSNARSRPDVSDIKPITNMQKRWLASQFIFPSFDELVNVLGIEV